MEGIVTPLPSDRVAFNEFVFLVGGKVGEEIEPITFNPVTAPLIIMLNKYIERHLYAFQ